MVADRPGDDIAKSDIFWWYNIRYEKYQRIGVRYGNAGYWDLYRGFDVD
jgi:hypothetical protein